jgi:hypothetical protein
MIMQPAILALLCASVLTDFLVLLACRHGLRILAKWDMRSGSELQLTLERRTYLISTILGYALSVQIFSLFLFIYTADFLHGRFIGAMCAAGTLNVNGFGYPLMIMKIVNFLLACLWLIINHADTKGYDYPLIKVKYTLLLAIAPMFLLELFFQFSYFTGLHADVITSCCGSLFSMDKTGVAGDLPGLPAGPMMAAFYASMAATVLAGLHFYRRGTWGYLFSAAGVITFCVSAAALLSFISLYFYQLPTHHCPFCILQKEYGYVGYVLYATLLGGGVAGLGVGALLPFRSRSSLAGTMPLLQRRLTAVTVTLYLVFTLIVTLRIMFSPFHLF